MKEVQMGKSRKATVAKPTPRKTSRKPARSTKPKQRAITAASSRSIPAGTPAASVRPSKKATILALLQRPNGAPIGDLTRATGWQAHVADDPRGRIQNAGTGTGRALGGSPPPAVPAGTGSGSAAS